MHTRDGSESEAPGPSTGPLSGLLVIDLTRVIAGPLCGRILADLGAEVVKVEPPEQDLTREVEPFVGGMSPYFTQLNAGKRGVAADLTDPDVLSIVTSMVASADVLVENFRPGVLDRFGLGPSAAMELNPRLIYCSITGYGSEGPWSRRRAFAPAVHAETGLIDIVSRRTGRPPEPFPQSHADTYSAVMASAAITTALYQRERTGQGQQVSLSLAGVAVYMNEWTSLELAGGDDVGHFGPANTLVVQVADGTWVATAGHPAKVFPRWAAAMDRPELLEDGRFATRDARDDNLTEVHQIIRAFAAAQRSFEDLEKICAAHGIVVGRVRSIVELAETAWAGEVGAFTELEGGIRVATRPWSSSVASIGVAGPAPRYGEHSAQYLKPPPSRDRTHEPGEQVGGLG